MRSEYLNYLRIREWQDVVTQLRELAKPLGIVMNAPRNETAAEEDPLKLTWDGDRIHVAILAGLLSQIGMQEATEVAAPAKGKRPRSKRPRNEYLGARGARFAIFPGSGLARKPPAWVMAAELVETSRLWGRDVARIQPEWAEEVGAHLVKRTYSEPAWSTKQGAATAFERVLLYGVPIVTNRRVLYAKVDPEHARELFVRHALVQGEWTTHHQFFHENRRLLAEAEGLEARARRRDLVVDDDTLFAFYDERVPDDVVSARHFDQWWKTARRDDPDLLSFTRELLVGEAGAIDESSFPSRWPQGDLRLPLTYQFEPGTEADGVTVHIPLTTLARLTPDGFGWMVPGLREELVTATIRALPKPVRVQLVPAPDVARAVDALDQRAHRRLGGHRPRRGRRTVVPRRVPTSRARPARRRRARRRVRRRPPARAPAHDVPGGRGPRGSGRRGQGPAGPPATAGRSRRRRPSTTPCGPPCGRRWRRRAGPRRTPPVPVPTSVAGRRRLLLPRRSSRSRSSRWTATTCSTWPADLPELPEVARGRRRPCLPVAGRGERWHGRPIRSLADESARPAARAQGLRRLLLLDVGLAAAPHHEPLDRDPGPDARVEPVPERRTRWSRTCSWRRSTVCSVPPVRSATRHLRGPARQGPRRPRGHGPCDRQRPRRGAHRRA